MEDVPFAQMERIANQEPGYDEDFMTYDRMDLYIHRLASVKEDVFELCSLNYRYRQPFLCDLNVYTKYLYCSGHGYIIFWSSLSDTGLQRYNGAGFKLDINLGGGYGFNESGSSFFSPMISFRLGWRVFRQ